MQFVFIRNDGNVIDLSLRLKQKVIMGGISVLLSLGLAVVLVSYFKLGIIGLCLGIITGRIILSIGYPVLVGRLLNISFLSQLKSAFRPIMITVLIFILATNLDLFVLSNNNFKLSGWIGLGFEVGVTFLILIATTFFAGLSRNQRNAIIHRLRIVMKLSSQ